ncbi:MAG: transcriptional regulator, GntR family [Pseudomonas sp.]|nr:transcriptional regulator, GntR family [Pseudomonas sp.]
MSEELERPNRKARTESSVALVQAEIERLILAGDLVPGERINESSLAERLGLSRGPIREASRMLVQTGLVKSVLNRGLFVSEISAKDALDIYDIRIAMFGLAARLAAQYMNKERITKLQDLVDRMEDAAEGDSIEAFYPLNRAFHDEVEAGADNPRIVELMQQLERQLHLFRQKALIRPGAMRASNNEHRALLLALKKGDSVEAGLIAERHIQAGRQRLLTSLADAKPK